MLFDKGRQFPQRHCEERHQWLELTLRPSLESYVCDLWVADAVGNDALRWHITEDGAAGLWFLVKTQST